MLEKQFADVSLKAMNLLKPSSTNFKAVCSVENCGCEEKFSKKIFR